MDIRFASRYYDEENGIKIKYDDITVIDIDEIGAYSPDDESPGYIVLFMRFGRNFSVKSTMQHIARLRERSRLYGQLAKFN